MKNATRFCMGLLLMVLPFCAISQTSLSAGDIAFVGINTDPDDQVTFVLLRDIAANTTIQFTDAGWDDTPTAGFDPVGGDLNGSQTWTATSALTCGTMIRISNPTSGGPTVTIGTISGPSLLLSSIGDQVFAFQGTFANPTLIAGVHTNFISGTTTTGNWDGNATSNSTSALPDVLTNGVDAILLQVGGGESDNWIYDCSTTTGTAAALRAAINNLANWNNDNTTPYASAPPCTFTCQAAVCNDPDIPTINATATSICVGDMVTLSIASGNLNDATDWQWYADGCGTTSLGSGTSIMVSPSFTTSYFVRGEGGCVVPGACASQQIQVQGCGSTLGAGDIAFISLNTDGSDDDFCFVLLEDIVINTEIHFTDCGWNDGGAGFNCPAGDIGFFTWRATSAMSCGDVICIEIGNGNATIVPTVGVAFGDPMLLSTAGDQVFAFQGNHDVTATFLAGIHYNFPAGSTDGNWDGSSTTNTTSALPNSLTPGLHALRVYDTATNTEVDNMEYNCAVTSGSKNAVLLAVNDRANWNINHTTPFPTPPSCIWNVNCAVVCNDPDVPTISASDDSICAGDMVTISVTGGMLNDATDWHWYADGCGVTAVGTGTSIMVSPTVPTTYSVRGEGNCVIPGACASVTIYVSGCGDTLQAGDVAFVALNSDGTDDEFCIMLMTSISNGTEIRFTDAGWTDGLGFTTDPPGDAGFFTWRATSALSCGEVICFATNGGAGVPVPSTGITYGSPMLLTTLGDQVFAFQGTFDMNASFLAGIHYSVIGATSDTDWDGGRSSNFTSGLPNTLTNGVNAIWVYDDSGGPPTEVDNMIFDCTVPIVDVTTINDVDNWLHNTTTPFTVDPFPCTVSCEPDLTFIWNADTLSIGDTICLDTFQNGFGFICTGFEVASTGSLESLDIDSTAILSGPWYFFSGINGSYPPGTSVFDNLCLSGQCMPGTYSSEVAIYSNDPDENPFTFFIKVTIIDTIGPGISCPMDQTVDTDPGVCTAVVNYSMPTSLDPCLASIMQINGLPSGSMFPLGTTTNTFVATDSAGNSDTCSFTITVVDNEDPVLSCPGDITVPNDPGQCSAQVSVMATVSDNCDPNPSVSNTFNGGGLDASGVYPVGTTVVNFVAFDNAGNTDTCTVSVTVEDTEDPVLNCPPDITVPTIGSLCNATVSLMVTATDNCPGPITIVNDFNGGGADASGIYSGTTVVTFTATDVAGNSSNCMVTVVVEDNTPPQITCPADITVNNDPGLCGAEVDFQPTATDNCPGVVVTTSPPSDSFFPVGTTTVLATATDAAGNTDTCSFTVTVIDNEGPVISCPADATVQCDESTAPTNTGTATGVDNCDPNPAITFSDLNDLSGCNGTGTISRTWTATDADGNSTSCVQIITIIDDTDPEITCPADVTIQCDDDQTPASLGSATAIDNCDANPVINFTDATIPGNCPGNYTIQRTWSALDACGNFSSCVQTITVIDTQAPVPPAAPADVTVECMADVPAPAFLMAQDNCEGMIVGVVSDSITPGICPNEKTIVRTWLFKDGCNNAVTVSQTIVVDDNTAPDAPDLPDLVFQCADDVPLPAGVVTALDNCDGTVVGVLDADTIPGSCVNNFVITRTYFFTDACGNQSSEVQTITVNDDTDPVASCPPDVSGLQCGDTPPAAATTIADFLALGGTVSDNCTDQADISISSSDSDNGNTECVSDGIRVITRTYTFTDECGNSTSCDQTFTYDEDTSAPDITCPADESDLDCNYVVPAGATDIASFLALGGTASDNCTATADLSVSYVDNDNMTLSCPGDARVIVRTYTITDGCGNSATCDQTFTYEEITTPPVINCPPDLVCLCGNPNNPLLISNWLSSVTASSDCPLSVSITNDYPNGIFTPDCGNAGTQEVTFTATDQCGNVSECTATITFVDNNPPELDCPAPLTVGTDGGLGAGGFCQDNPDPVVAVIGTYLFADDVANDLIAAGYNATHYSSVPSAATLAGIDVVMLIRAFGNTDLENWVQAGGLLVTEWTATDWAINTAGLLQGNVFHVGFLGTGTPVKFEATPEGMALGAGMDNPYSDTERTQFFRGFSGLGAGTSVIATRPGNQPAIVGGESGSGYVLAIGYCWSDRFNSQPNAQTDLLMDNAIAYCLGTDGCVATIGPGVVAIDAFDKCDPNFTVTNDSPHADDNNSADAAGVYPKGVYDITFTATDACGNVSSCVVSLTVEDDDPAVISCPDDIVVDADPGECGAIVSFNLPEFADNCPDPILTQVSGLGSGDFFPTGTTVQEYMVIDCGGNVSMCSFSVTVNNTLKSKCTTYSYAPGTPSDHALLLNNLPFGLNSRFLWVGGQGTLDVFLDGTARLSGQVVNVSDANAIFDVDMNFENEMSWAMWSALGRNYKANAVNQAVADANHMDWTFWELGTATITGAAGSTYDGDVISMTHKPADYSYGFQLGLGANDKDTDYGFSGWFYYSGTLGGQNTSGDGDVNNDASCQENPCGVSIAVAPRMMLEGPFNAATMKMNDDLRVAGYIPLSEPYTSYGFPHAGNGGGESMDQTVLQQTGDDAIVDWVVVSLRNINDIETILATKSALLQADGDIVDVDGVSPVSFEGVAAGQYHVGIHHENHLWVVSNYTYNLSASAQYLDFSDGSVLAFGEDGLAELAALIKGSIGYDLNGDGTITAADRTLAWNMRNQVGDLREDGNMDGAVNAIERSRVWNNRNIVGEDPAQF